jgi:hypothetical protein
MEKIVSQLDDEGYFVGTVAAEESPREPGIFLIPGGCVELDAPKVEKGKRYRIEGGAWVEEAMPEQEQTQPEQVPDRRAEILGQLATIDAASVRPAREVAAALATGEPAPQFATDKLVQLEEEAAGMRAELASLGAV